MPVRVRLKRTYYRVDGATFPAGREFRVAREYLTNRETILCLALMDETGAWVIPCVDSEDVEEIIDDAKSV